tara:strand:+ start:310 stop:519 length:210 start_codon:yes stop_codon:yes gene_type:complete
MKAGDLVRIKKKHHGAYELHDDRLGKVGILTEDVKTGHMAWVVWPPRPYTPTMDYPEDLEIVSSSINSD